MLTILKINEKYLIFRNIRGYYEYFTKAQCNQFLYRYSTVEVDVSLFCGIILDFTSIIGLISNNTYVRLCNFIIRLSMSKDKYNSLLLTKEEVMAELERKPMLFGKIA